MAALASLSFSINEQKASDAPRKLSTEASDCDRRAELVLNTLAFV